MKERQVNFDDMRFLFRESRPTQEAVDILSEHGRSGDVRYLNDMLRWHGDLAIANAAEIRKRDSFDNLLDYYALLEAACLADYIPCHFAEDFRAEALFHLEHPSVLRYYEEYYPVYLATLFRRRLKNEVSIAIDIPRERSWSFSEFIGLVTAYDTDKNLRRFEWLLDGGSTGGYRLRHLTELFVNPSELARVLLQPKDSEERLHQVTLGFYKFIQFTQDLMRILDRATTAPVLRAAMWFYYAYWFDIVGKRVSKHLRTALSVCASWPSEGQDRVELENFTRTAVSTIETLTGGTIGHPLVNVSRVGVRERMTRRKRKK